MSEGKHLVLLVEDDEDIAFLVERLLKRNGYETLLAFTAAKARELVGCHKPDLFVLDVELPDGDGFELCKETRRGSDAPVIFLTGRKTPRDKLEGMGIGGDYYITKPFNKDEFLGIAAILLQKAEQSREKLAKAVSEAVVISRGNLTLDMPRSKAYLGGRDAELTQKEFAVLLMLVQNEDKELTGEAIYESVWNTPLSRDTGSVRVHISNLKKKLCADNTDSFDIMHEQGKGYKFTTN